MIISTCGTFILLSLSCFPLSHSTSVSHVRGSVQVSQSLDLASKLRDSSMDELIPGCAYSERIYRSLSLFLNSCPRTGVESGRGRSLPQADIISLLGDGVGDMVNVPLS